MHNDDTFVAQTNIIIENLTHAIQQALESKPDETAVRLLISQEIKQLTRTYDVKLNKLEEEIRKIHATLSQPRTATKPTSTRSRTSVQAQSVPAQPLIQQQHELVTTHKSPNVDCPEIATIRTSTSYKSIMSDKTESILTYFNIRLIQKADITERNIDIISLLICLIKLSDDFKDQDDMIIHLFLGNTPSQYNHALKAFVDGFNFTYAEPTNNRKAFKQLLDDNTVGKVNHKYIQLGNLKKKYSKFKTS